MERRLAAILAADVVGYSRLIREDEARTLTALKAHREELIEPKLAQYHGRIVKLMGDGLLAEFPSAVEAVQCAVELQHLIGERSAEVPENRRIAYRIGINIGDIVVEDDDIYGDGVNVAARLEGLAEPGGICVSRTVFNHVKDKLDLTFEHLGEREVKNIAEPISVYRVVLDDKAAAILTPLVQEVAGPEYRRWPVAAAAVAVLVLAVGGALWWQPWKPDVEPALVERMAYPLPEKPSVAVLPFDNLSGDPEQEFFADGITNDIITDLSRFGDLVVIAAHSTFTYKGKPVKVQQVAEELGVRYVVEGSVQKAGNRVRINAQFIDAITGEHLWSERYARDLSDVFAVQDEITQKIVGSLGTWSGRVAVETRERARQRATTDLTAYEYFVLGLELGQRFTKEDNTKARALFEKAIERDPRYARAYAALAWTHYFEWKYGWAESDDLPAARAYELAKTAVELDDGEAEAHWILAEVYFVIRRQPEEAIAEFERALTLNPNHPDILADWGGYGMPGLTGRADEGIELVEKAMRLNPSHPDWYERGLGLAAYVARRYDEAISAFRKVEHHTPESRATFAASYAQLGRMEEARAEVARLLDLQPEFSIRNWTEKFYFKNPADLEHYANGLRKAGLPEHPPLPLPDKPSIAVLPFNNMSDDPGQEYFADGMTEDVITDLSKISGLFVIARNSSFSYKGQQVKVRQVAEELGVRYVLEGSVRRAGDQVRINAQLIDATTGGHIWAERYDGTLEDIFDLQDRVTEQIVAALAVSLTGEEQAQQARHGTENAQAHDAYLQGWARYKLLTPDDLAEAVPFLEEAIRLDPNYAQAHAALASLYWDALGNDWAFDLDMPSSRAEAFANKHLEEALENPTPLAHVLQARMLASWGYHDAAVVEAQQAVALDHNDATAHAGLADALVLAGRAAEAVEPIEKAIRLDPHHPPSYLITLGAAQFGMKQYEKAAEIFERAAKLNPGNEVPLIYLASSYGHLGRIEDADNAIETANDLRNMMGLGELSIRPGEDFAVYAANKWEFNFERFGSKSARDHLRSGLTDIPALKWQYLITPHRALDVGSSWLEVEGATEIDIPTAKSFHDRGVIFIDVSGESMWNAGHIPGAVHLSWERTGDPGRVRFSKTALREVAQYDDEIVLYFDDGSVTSAAWEAAKAVTWGYRKVYLFDGGAKAWKEAGYPVETGD